MPLTSVCDPWPFHQWGIDIVRPFLTAPGGDKLLMVPVNFFNKWIEAEPLTTITGGKMMKFMWKNILTNFGTLRILIRDNRTRFKGSTFKEWCEEKKFHHRFTSVAHPQANGQMEVSIKTIFSGFKKCLMKSKGA